MLQEIQDTIAALRSIPTVITITMVLVGLILIACLAIGIAILVHLSALREALEQTRTPPPSTAAQFTQPFNYGPQRRT